MLFPILPMGLITTSYTLKCTYQQTLPVYIGDVCWYLNLSIVCSRCSPCCEGVIGLAISGFRV